MSATVSVVMASHNRADLIERTLDSLRSQTYSDLEVIVVDDCSQDNTVEVLRNYQKRVPTLQIIALDQNVGPGKARNTGIQQAHGKYVAIMDDDDVCVPTRIEQQVNLMEANPEVDLCFGLVEWRSNLSQPGVKFPGLLVRKQFPTDPDTVFKLLLLKSNKAPNVTLLARHQVFMRFPYAEDVRSAEDWYMLMTMSANGVCMRGIPEVLVHVDRSPAYQGLMKNRERAHRDQRKILRRVCEEQKLPASLRRQVFSNQYLREAAQWGGWRAVMLIFRALSLWPSNRDVYTLLRERSINALRKLTQISGGT